MESGIRVLHVLGRLDRGGAETMVMNLYRHMDRRRIQFDFVIHTEDVCDYTREVQELGGRIYSMAPFGVSTAGHYRRDWRNFFCAHPEYRMIHGHMRSTASLYLEEAKRAGLVTIVHSHNTSSGHGVTALVKNVLQYPLRWQADYLFACSKGAGIWLYGRRACDSARFRLLYNGITAVDFRFDPAMRQAKRRELLGDTAQDCPVFLHIGRLEPQKNHTFLLRIMQELAVRRPAARLWLCGCGPLDAALKRQAQESGLAGRVCFLGVRTDIPGLMQAADMVLFPSLFEGLPVTLVEAQAAGLPVLMSDTVTPEAALTDLVRTLPLSEPPARWAETALQMLPDGDGACAAETGKTAGTERAAYAALVARGGYDAAENAARLARFYEDALRQADGKDDRKNSGKSRSGGT